MNDDGEIGKVRSSYFGTTHWTIVLAAGKSDSSEALLALESLCRSYWYPIYAFVRRRGHSPEEAEDLTQGFFGFLIEQGTMSNVDRAKGKFRSFLLATLTNFLNNEYDRQRAQKRGGGSKIVSWDQIDAEERYRHEPTENFTPEQLFERRWAYTLIEQVLDTVRGEYERDGRGKVVAALHVFLTSEPSKGALDAVALDLGVSIGAANVALHRLRRRFGEALKAAIANTVSDPGEIDSEIRHLFAAIAA